MNDKTTKPLPEKPRGEPERRQSVKSLPKIVEVAHKFLVGGKTGRELATQYGVSIATIASWVAEAKEKGLVRLDIDRSYLPSGKLNAAFSNKLKAHAHLVDCWVYQFDEADLRLPSFIPDQPYNDGPVPPKERELALLIGVASTVGKHVAAKIVPGAHVGTAGGRAVYLLCRSIAKFPPVQNVHVTPLSARIWNRLYRVTDTTNDIFDRPLEADDNAQELALSIGHGQDSSSIRFGLPLYCESRAERDTLIMRNCPVLRDLVDGRRLERDLKIALLGVGSFSDHRLQQYVDIDRGAGSRTSDGLSGKARTLLDEAEKIVEYDRLVEFGDVANRLYPQFPLPHELPRKQDSGKFLDAMERLSLILEQLNDLAIAPEWFQLRRAAFSVLIATGKKKQRAMWTLALCGHLFKGSQVMTSITTDLVTAGVINTAFEALEKSPSMQQFYREAFERLNMFDHKGRKLALIQAKEHAALAGRHSISSPAPSLGRQRPVVVLPPPPASRQRVPSRARGRKKSGGETRPKAH